MTDAELLDFYERHVEEGQQLLNESLDLADRLWADADRYLRWSYRLALGLIVSVGINLLIILTWALSR